MDYIIICTIGRIYNIFTILELSGAFLNTASDIFNNVEYCEFKM